MLTFAAALLAVFLWAGLAGAQSAELARCNDAKQLFADLEAASGERPVVSGKSVTGRIYTFTASEYGTWTLVASFGTRRACIVEHGEDWAMLRPKGEGL